MTLPLLNVAPRVRHGKVFLAILQADLRELDASDIVTMPLLSLQDSDGLQTTQRLLRRWGYAGVTVHLPDGTSDDWTHLGLLAAYATPANYGQGAAFAAPDGAALCAADARALLATEPDSDLWAGEVLADLQSAITDGICKMEVTSLLTGKPLFTIGTAEALG